MYGRSAEPKDVIKGVEDISKAKWYVGKTPRVECDKAVLAANVGDWLVRMSSSGTTYVICINDSGICQNYQVHIKGKKFSMGGVDFNSVMECLMFLRANPINGRAGRLYYLGKPASDSVWYVGAMAKPECDKMVLAAGKSDFLIRLASDRKDYVLCINQGNGKAKNCKIFTGGVANSFTLGQTTEKTLEDLIETLKDVPIPTNDNSGNLYLRKPAAKADYYAGQMPRAEAEGYVKKGATGDYLIRQNTKGDKYVLVVNDNKAILNFIISQTAEGKFEFGGLPHDSLEMVIRYLKKAPLASKSGGQVFINRPARMTNADDMIADVQFGGFGDEEEEEEYSAPSAPRRSLQRGGDRNAPPAFDSEEEDFEEDEEDYDDAVGDVERFQPFRVKSTREITGICKADVGLFVIAKKTDTTYLAVYNGEQVVVPMDAVEKEETRTAAAFEEEDDDENDGFGEEEEEDEEEEEEEEDQETSEEKEARLEAKKAEMAAKVAAAKEEALAKMAAENASADAAIKAEADALKAKMAEAGMDDEEIGGFGEDFDEDD